MPLSKAFNILDWLLRIVVAVILLQTLFFKFSGAKESVYIFTTLGAEPWGRIGSGVVELIASILILVPRTAVIGAILALGTICGALFAHLTKLGIKLPAVDDHGRPRGGAHRLDAVVGTKPRTTGILWLASSFNS